MHHNQKQHSNKRKSYDGNTGQNNDSEKDYSGTYSAFFGLGATTGYALYHIIPFIDSSINLTQHFREYFSDKSDFKSNLSEEDLKIKESNSDFIRKEIENRIREEIEIREKVRKGVKDYEQKKKPRS